jgi:signal transduction histidine kinase
MKESLNNIIKYAGASEVCVQIKTRWPDLLLRVRDNGCGFEPALREGDGNGLGNMRKRVKDLGGEFTLRSAPHQGTDIEVSVPINPRDESSLGNGS